MDGVAILGNRIIQIADYFKHYPEVVMCGDTVGLQLECSAVFQRCSLPFPSVLVLPCTFKMIRCYAALPCCPLHGPTLLSAPHAAIPLEITRSPGDEE